MVCEDLKLDKDGSVTLGVINRLIQENYGFIFVFLLIFGFLAFIGYYFLKDLMKIISGYYGYSKKLNMPGFNIPSLKSTGILASNPEDNEVYNDSALNTDDIDSGFNKETNDFYDVTLDETFSNYNKLKAQYINTNYPGTTDDDQIDKEVVFTEYDDYSY